MRPEAKLASQVARAIIRVHLITILMALATTSALHWISIMKNNGCGIDLCSILTVLTILDPTPVLADIGFTLTFRFDDPHLSP